MPVFYECDRCTACCRWPGQVKLTDAEISAMAGYLSVSEDEFIQQYTRIHTSRKALALEDKANGECVFLDGDTCRVNPVKPQQCRDFPNVWNFPNFQQFCRAKAVVMSDEEYRQALQRARAGPGLTDD